MCMWAYVCVCVCVCVRARARVRGARCAHGARARVRACMCRLVEQKKPFFCKLCYTGHGILRQHIPDIISIIV